MFVTAGLGAGGAEKNTVTVANALADTAEVSVFCVYPGGENAQFLSEKVRLIRASKHRMLASVGSLVAAIRDVQPHVLIGNKDDVALVALAAKYISRRRVGLIARVANKPVFCYGRKSLRRRLYILLLNVLYRRCCQVVSVSQSLKNELCDVFGLDDARIRVIYNPPGVVKEDAVFTLPANIRTSRKIVTVGRLVAQKNHRLFLEVAASLAEEIECEFYIIGKGPLRETLREQAESAGIAAQVHFIDYVDNPVALLREADLFLMTSNHEGLPGSLIHALISGVNIVSTDCEHGVAEVLDNGRFGLLVPVGDKEQTVRACNQALASPPTYSASELQTHLQKFDSRLITSQWQTLLEQCRCA